MAHLLRVMGIWGKGQRMAEERKWPGWKARLFTLEKRKPWHMTVGQFIALAIMMIGVYLGTHGWPN
jgi:hypothetical protein